MQYLIFIDDDLWFSRLSLKNHVDHDSNKLPVLNRGFLWLQIFLTIPVFNSKSSKFETGVTWTTLFEFCCQYLSGNYALFVWVHLFANWWHILSKNTCVGYETGTHMLYRKYFIDRFTLHIYTMFGMIFDEDRLKTNELPRLFFRSFNFFSRWVQNICLTCYEKC
jgi:hypothetical protein